MDNRPPPTPSTRSLDHAVKWIGLALGPLLALTLYLLLRDRVVDPTVAKPADLTRAGLMTLCMGVWMAVWWLTEAIHISITALLPLVLIPLLNIGTMRSAAAPFAEPIIFLFLGGFLIGAAVQRWGLHKRMAYLTVLACGSRPSVLVAGMMAITAFLSMWISNTATAVMMFPIAISLVALAERSESDTRAQSNWSPADVTAFGYMLMLGIAYAATIGGMGTPIGTPPNAILLRYAEERFNLKIGFDEWMIVALPSVLIILPLIWFVLTRAIHRVSARSLPGGRAFARDGLRRIGPLGRGEITVLVVFTLAALAWVARTPVTGALPDGSFARAIAERITDAGIAVTAAVLLFLIPVNFRERRFALEWADTDKVPWGVLLLFGGGLSLAQSIESSGLDQYLGALAQGFGGLPVVIMLLGVSLLVILLSEFASNTAVAATMIPVLGAVAVAGGFPIDPMLLLFTITLAASLGVALPVATPPNAIAFATGRLPLRVMIKAGVFVDVITAISVVGVMYLFGPTLLRWAGLLVGEP
ncbi:MAG: SLC13/DASS family transporter [Phycisphaeraceae bacterium]|nr:SLC13/DASS family transporter [Phycisphaeraceae bacterium]